MGIISTILSLIAFGIGLYLLIAVIAFLICIVVFVKFWKTHSKISDEFDRCKL